MSKLKALTQIADRLLDRTNDWLDVTNTEDISQRIPDERVRRCIELAGKLHIEVAKLELDGKRVDILAKGRGHTHLTDAEYEEGMAKLQQEAMREMSTEALAREVKRRQMVES